MLQIKDIRKTYVTGELVQTALDGVSLNLRDNEFVAILGPSGSGKTTLLNVIGGLDRYDSGDLVINGISTRKYSDRDWDSYRNHTIGFVFQSYNLIPHQSVLANVELALTISGISRAERRRRAAKALEDVGLGNQLHKKPNQMSGGQMQRVAIARALVNDPDILLADEPTGALDSKTSVQVMELLKEVSRDRLVVMVTHNPELAEDYANRIVRVKDGRIIDDTNPYPVDETVLEAPKHKNMGKSSMSFWTAMTLSFNNLRTKKARTLLTSFAGSIGIIGIALIMSLSTGFQKYIDKIQADTLSNYPLTIQTETSDMSSMFAAFGASIAQANEADEGVVVEQQMIAQMFAQVGSNDLESFRTHLEENYDEVAHTVSSIKYSYGLSPRIYVESREGDVLQANPATLFNKLMGNSFMASYMATDVFYEMIDNREMLDSQYEVLRGRWPETYNELIVVLQDPSQITDYMAYTLGLKDADLLDSILEKMMAGELVESVSDTEEWTYDDLMNLNLRLTDVSDLYRYNSEYNLWEDMSEKQTYLQDVFEQSEQLRVVGIVCAREGANATALSAGIAYTPELTQFVIDRARESELVKAQLENPEVDIFSGSRFDEEAETSLNFENMVSVDGDAISSAFGMNISTDQIVSMLKGYLQEVMNSVKVDTGPAQDAFLEQLRQMSTEMLQQYVAANADENGEAKLYLTEAEGLVDSYLSTESAAARIAQLSKTYSVPEDAFRKVYRPLMLGLVTGCVAEDLKAETGTPETETPEAEVPEVEVPEVEAPVAEIPEVSSSSEPEEVPSATEASPGDAEENVPAETTPAESQPEESTPPADEPEETMPSEAETDEMLPPEENTEETLPPEENTEQTLPPDEDTEETLPPEEEAEETIPPDEETEDTLPPEEEPETPDMGIDTDQFYGTVTAGEVDGIVSRYMGNAAVTGAASVMSAKMMEATVLGIVREKISGFGGRLAAFIGSSFSVDADKIANAFQFNMNEEDLQRLMMTMSGQNREHSADANLRNLGYARIEKPYSMSIYLVDFAAKEEFMAFLDQYNEDMQEQGKEEQVIQYTDLTGMMMSSVRTIIDSVSYALIAFVAVSLVVSSIMIGIITYISVMERTKEIGILRAIGASKGNISQVFNAETFMIGLCSGLIGIGITLLVLIPGNMLIQHLTDNPDIVAQLPMINAIVLIGLSVVLTLIGGLIPASKAAKKDPVIALRSE